MTAFASPDDIAERWRPLTVDEQITASTLLDRVSSLIRVRLPMIDGRVAADPNLAVLVRGVAVDAVLRVLRNPDGLVQESVGGYSYSRAAGTNSGDLYISDGEWATLQPAARASAAFTVHPWATR